MARILITGANRGIGLELARIYAGRGDEVIAAVRHRSDALEALNVRIEDLDVTDDASVAALARRLQGKKLDVLINNAGILERDGLRPADVEAIRRQFEVNAIGPVRVTSALLPNLHEGSKVVIVTSRMGSIGDNGSGGYYGYRMSKAAVNAAGVSMARDLESQGIAVLLLHPGAVRTEMTGGGGSIDAPDAAAQLVQRIDELELASTGSFLHANGSPLPW